LGSGTVRFILWFHYKRNYYLRLFSIAAKNFRPYHVLLVLHGTIKFCLKCEKLIWFENDRKIVRKRKMQYASTLESKKNIERFEKALA